MTSQFARVRTNPHTPACARRVITTVFFALWCAFDSAHAARNDSITDNGFSVPYEQAIGKMNDGEYDVAVIHLKNILQQNPEHIPSRILLGRAYLRQSYAIAAEKEFRNALWRGADKDHIFVPLANALFIQRKYEEILHDIKSTTPGLEASFEVLTIRGRANYELGRLDQAAKDFEHAVELADGEVNPLLGRASVANAQGDFEAALSDISRALDLEPKNAEAWYQRAEILRGRAKHENAQSAYSRAITYNENHMRARIGRASLSLFLGDFAAAADDAAYVNERSEANVTSAFILWQALLRLNRNDEAGKAFTTAADRLASLTDDSLKEQPSLLRIAGLIAFTKSEFERANHYFTRLLILRPQDNHIRKLLAGVQLRIGENEAASSTLYALTKIFPNDTELLVLLGEAHMNLGQYVAAADALERASRQNPDDLAIRTQLALSRVGAGEVDAAISDLKEMVSLRSATTSAGILLTTLQLKRDDTDEALASIATLHQVHPNNPIVKNLRGTVLLKRNDRMAATRAFKAALDVEPGFIPALYNLAQMSLDDADFDDAERRYNGILQLDPRSVPALMGLADIAITQRDRPKAVRLLERTIITDPTNRKPFKQLVELHLSFDDVNNATRAAEQLLENHYGSMDAFEMLARTQVAAGRRDDAMLSFRHAKQAAGFSGQDLLRIARSQVQIEDYAGARSTLLKAINSDLLEGAYAALVRLDLLLGSRDAATTRALELSEKMPGSALGHILVAEVSMDQGSYREAISSYRRAIAIDDGADQIIGLANAQHFNNDPQAAIITLRTWLQEHPSNLFVERELALRLIGVHQLDEAQRILERLSRTVKDDVVTLTTLARCYQIKKDGRAQATARTAYALRPEWSVSAETLGWILVTEGDSSAGLKYLREAFSRDKNPLTRFHIASALAELGRSEEAKDELKVLLKRGQALPWIASVEALYAEQP
jgi:putative PEP-CTERM system TPR-repeat lipoprotein